MGSVEDRLRALEREFTSTPQPDCTCESAKIIIGADGRAECARCKGQISEQRAMAAMFPPGLIPPEPDPLDSLIG